MRLQARVVEKRLPLQRWGGRKRVAVATPEIGVATLERNPRLQPVFDHTAVPVLYLATLTLPALPSQHERLSCGSSWQAG